MALTEIQCKTAKPKEKAYKLSDAGGLYLEVAPSGSKYWRLKYRFHGKEKRLALGVYPSVSLADARRGRDRAKDQLREGKDPSAVKKETKLEHKFHSDQTFETIFRTWYDLQVPKWVPRHAQNIKNRIEADILPPLGSRPISGITSLDVLAAIQKIEERAAHDIAHRALQTCKQVFGYALILKLVTYNPAEGLTAALKQFKRGHFAALSFNDISPFLKALEKNDTRLYPQTRHAVKMLMLTFVRTSELIGAKWDEMDLEKATWEIPAERMKMDRPHIVPLSRQAVQILKEQKLLVGKSILVFPNQVRPAKSMSNNTILTAIDRLGFKEKTTGHGFRALAMTTIKERLNYRHEVIDRQLAHAPRNKIDAAYDRAEFLEERTKMMQEYADLLDSLASGTAEIHILRKTA